MFVGFKIKMRKKDVSKIIIFANSYVTNRAVVKALQIENVTYFGSEDCMPQWKRKTCEWYYVSKSVTCWLAYSFLRVNLFVVNLPDELWIG